MQKIDAEDSENKRQKPVTDPIIQTTNSTKSISQNKYTNRPFCTDLLDKNANPIGPYQWHLYSYGNPAYSTAYTEEEHTASLGQDINAYEVLKDYCLSGHGVRVAVLDTGLQTAHPSLAPNIDNRPYKSKTWSVNYRDNSLLSEDPSPIEDDGADHGTMVSGIIAMRSNLGFGGSGVAPHAALSGYNVISDDAQLFDNFYDSLGSSDAAKNNDVFNMSYGLNNTSQVSEDEPTELAGIAMYKTGTRLLRHGKGAVYVQAAGNGFKDLGSMFDFTSCSSANKYKVSCQNTNMQLDHAMPEVLVIGALTVSGKKSSYSTTGASIWVSAPGGEYGVDKNWVGNQFKRFDKEVTWNLYPETIGEPAVMSTDMMGPRAGSATKPDMDNTKSIINARNVFNAGLVPENHLFNYTSSMNGTSAATPVASGAIAVLLQANPKLTWRDVKYILANTATKVDPDFSGVTAELSQGEFQLEQGWITNMAGYNFSNWYGFGRINLKAAVDMAVDYDYPLGTYVEKPWWPKGKKLNRDVPVGDSNGVAQIVTVSAHDNLVVESMQVKLSLESTYLGDLAVEVTSPSGTKSIIWHAANGFSNNGNLSDMKMLSNAFYGEDSVGDWTVRVINTGMHDAPATWSSLQLKVTGYNRGK